MKSLLGENAHQIPSQCKEFIDKYSPSIDKLVSDFGLFSAKDLELRTTLIYLNKHNVFTEDELAKQLKELKPYFPLPEIESAIKELGAKSFIKIIN